MTEGEWSVGEWGVVGLLGLARGFAPPPNLPPERGEG